MRATVFGLDVESDRELAFLAGARAAPTGRALELRVDAGEVDDPVAAAGELIADERDPGGRVRYQVRRGPSGLRIEGDLYGTSLLAPDGTDVRVGVDAGSTLSWQRLLIAQTLPLAAVLCGLEAIHAGAVVIDGEAVAVTGASGSGKTSLALALHAGGAGFLADDVLALELRGEELLAHPGAPVAGVDRGAVERLATLGAFSGEPLWVDPREEVRPMAPAAGPVPLRALFLLERSDAGPPVPSFEPVTDPREVLATTFVLLLESPERLGRLLAVAAALAAGRCERVRVAASVGVEELAEAIAARVRVAV